MRNEAIPSASRLIRQMYQDDAPHLKEILRESPETVSWLPDQSKDSEATDILLVSESVEHQVTGLIVVRQVADEAELLNIAVRSANRRSGIATQLLEAAASALRARSVTRLFLEVRESNAPAVAFYQKHGFRQVGTRPGYYRQPDEAALIFQLDLTTRAETSTRNPQASTT